MINPKQIRIDLGLTQAQMAQACGTSIKTWTSWEYGHRDPSGAAERLIALLGALNANGLYPWYEKKFMGD